MINMIAVVRPSDSPAPALYEISGIQLEVFHSVEGREYEVTCFRPNGDYFKVLGVDPAYYRAILDNLRVSGVADFTSWLCEFPSD